MADVPTTFQMDGLHTQEDIDRRHSVFKQCRDCTKWTKTDTRHKSPACEHCGSYDFDPGSTTSERSFNPMNKRRPKRGR